MRAELVISRLMGTGGASSPGSLSADSPAPALSPRSVTARLRVRDQRRLAALIGSGDGLRYFLRFLKTVHHEMYEWLRARARVCVCVCE